MASPDDHHAYNPERDFLACCAIDPQCVDIAMEAGLAADHFAGHREREMWLLMASQRGLGKGTDLPSLCAAAVDSGKLDSVGGYAGISEITRSESGTSAAAAPCLQLLLAAYARRESYKLLSRAMESVQSTTGDLQAVAKAAEEVVGLCAGGKRRHRSLDDVDNELEARVQQSRTGKVDDTRYVRWGIPKADKFMLPIRPHEYTLICARPSVGKSSMLTHLACHNLLRGLRVAYFSLETSDSSVFSQMAAQRAGVNLATMHEWMDEQVESFNDARRAIRDTKRLLIFDDILTLEGIQAKCRMLAGAWKPDVVFCDYLGLIGVKAPTQYERTTIASNSMIGIRKSLGCALIVANQLNRGPAGDNREPANSDLRDSGHCEQDAHRICMLHWKNNHQLDAPVRDYRLIQTKCRDGVITAVDGISFHAPTTRFLETAHNSA